MVEGVLANSMVSERSLELMNAALRVLRAVAVEYKQPDPFDVALLASYLGERQECPPDELARRTIDRLSPPKESMAIRQSKRSA